MPRVNRTQRHFVQVENCGLCGNSHSFPITMLLDEEIGVLGMTTTRLEISRVVLVCPEKGGNIVVTIPVKLTSFQSLREILGDL